MKQKTLSGEAQIEGIGLHTGKNVKATFSPAPPNSGILLQRVDIPGSTVIPARLEFVSSTRHRTALRQGETEIQSVEHLLSALYGLGVDNILVRVTGQELPILDGSALPYVKAFLKAGIEEQDVVRTEFRITSPLSYSKDGVEITAVPENELKVSFTIGYDHPFLQSQFASFSITPEVFLKEIAPARTYGFEEWVENLRAEGLIQGGSLENALVIGKAGLLNKSPLRFQDEFVRHKIGDLLGDLALLGVRVSGHIIAVKSGHETHIGFMKKLKEAVSMKDKSNSFEIDEILKWMPHRYPFLMVDRILELRESQVTGIKNVTLNEPFFQGHFPGQPFMPGVLIVESMAQIGGFLLLHQVENPENKLVFFTSIEHVKFRRPVRPGDQLRSEMEMVKFRKGFCIIRGKAYVGDDIVAEGEFTAVIRDKTSFQN
jgi:UDP-3-O-[3-hydroxymyristoyl] N-acetylglucosamine deacetylase/3-hydroxyacyl-[acyl-carrier-protein] dehydratase